jgi:predicted hotdog family 3-hydroxylacyl-ACP dehydratase
MSDRDQILAMIPHQGAMCLWDEVISWDSENIVLRAGNHRDATHPLRSIDGRLRAIHLCEYGAQAMAVHGGLRAHAAGARAKPGFLVALRGVDLHVDTIDQLPDFLQGTATLLVDGEGGWQYQFRIEHMGVLLAGGRAAVIPQPQAAAQASETGQTI